MGVLRHSSKLPSLKRGVNESAQQEMGQTPHTPAGHTKHLDVQKCQQEIIASTERDGNGQNERIQRAGVNPSNPGTGFSQGLHMSFMSVSLYQRHPKRSAARVVRTAELTSWVIYRFLHPSMALFPPPALPSRHSDWKIHLNRADSESTLFSFCRD